MTLRVWMLDDMPSRAELLEQFTGVIPELEPNVKSALETRSYVGADIWMLDHDLCVEGDSMRCPHAIGPYNIGCKCPSGLDFIRQVAEQTTWPKRVIVHSSNTTGRDRMMRLLEAAGCPKSHLMPVEHWKRDAFALRVLLSR